MHDLQHAYDAVKVLFGWNLANFEATARASDKRICGLVRLEAKSIIVSRAINWRYPSSSFWISSLSCFLEHGGSRNNMRSKNKGVLPKQKLEDVRRRSLDVTAMHRGSGKCIFFPMSNNSFSQNFLMVYDFLQHTSRFEASSSCCCVGIARTKKKTLTWSWKPQFSRENRSKSVY